MAHFSVRFTTVMVILGACVGWTSLVQAEECVDVNYSSYEEKGKPTKCTLEVDKTGVAEAICRDKVGGKARTKTAYCRHVNGLLPGTYEECAKGPAVRKVNPSEMQRCVSAPNLADQVKATWAKKACYVLGYSDCSPGVQVKDGCASFGTTSSKFYYTADCRAEAKVNAERCWVGMAVSSDTPYNKCEIGTVVEKLCKRDGVANDPGNAVYSTDNHCIARAGATGGGYGYGNAAPSAIGGEDLNRRVDTRNEKNVPTCGDGFYFDMQTKNCQPVAGYQNKNDDKNERPASKVEKSGN